MNKKKTKWQCDGKCKGDVLIDGEKIDRVDEFVYLGSVFTEDATDGADIERRIQKANAAQAQIRKILWNRETPRRLKIKMIMTFIYPTVSYCCETWTLGNAEKRRLDTWWMKLLRRVRGVTKRDKMRSKEIHKQLRTTSMSNMIEERQLRYLGHIMRYPAQRWVKYALTAARPSQTKKGREKKWKTQIEKILEKHKLTLKMARNKEKWKAKLARIFDRTTTTSEETQMQE